MPTTITKVAASRTDELALQVGAVASRFCSSAMQEMGMTLPYELDVTGIMTLWFRGMVHVWAVQGDALPGSAGFRPVVGMAVCAVTPATMNPAINEAHSIGLFIEPEYRGSGVLRQLEATRDDWLRANGVRTMVLSTAYGNPNMMKLQAAGYEPAEILMRRML